MRNSGIRAGALIVFTVAAAGCGKTDGGQDAGPAVPPLAVSTESIANGRIGAAYQQQLAASGGVKPYGWSLGNRSAELSWLRIDPVTGALSGVPSQAATAASVTVVVTDQSAATATRTFPLTVDACQGGDTAQCQDADGGVCRIGLLTCVNGAFPSTCPGQPSADPKHCGVDCGACGTTANSCTAGVCTCGSGPACNAGAICCGGKCVDPNDAHTCGGCGNDCAAQAGAHAVGSCVGGQCNFACEPGYLNCAPGSTPQAGCPVQIASDLQNCGGCNHVCATDLSTANAPTCNAGVCTITCHGDHLNCDNSPEDGCEVPQSPTDCNACGFQCHAAGTDNVAAPQCVPSGSSYVCSPQCNAGFANCDGIDSNGCEIDLTNDVNHCGNCNTQCVSVNGSGVACVAGSCKVTSCPPGDFDCDGNPANGCEVIQAACGCGCPANYGCDLNNGCLPCTKCGADTCCLDFCGICANGKPGCGC